MTKYNLTTLTVLYSETEWDNKSMNYFWMPYFFINPLSWTVKSISTETPDGLLWSMTEESSLEDWHSPTAAQSLLKSSSQAFCSAWLSNDRLRPKRPVLESPSRTPVTWTSSPALRCCDKIRRNSPRRPEQTSVRKISRKALPPSLTRRLYFS